MIQKCPKQKEDEIFLFSYEYLNYINPTVRPEWTIANIITEMKFYENKTLSKLIKLLSRHSYSLLCSNNLLEHLDRKIIEIHRNLDEISFQNIINFLIYLRHDNMKSIDILANFILNNPFHFKTIKSFSIFTYILIYLRKEEIAIRIFNLLEKEIINQSFEEEVNVFIDLLRNIIVLQLDLPKTILKSLKCISEYYSAQKILNSNLAGYTHFNFIKLAFLLKLLTLNVEKYSKYINNFRDTFTLLNSKVRWSRKNEITSSFSEINLLYYLKHYFPNVKSGIQIFGFEFDFYIPELDLYLDYLGTFHYLQNNPLKEVGFSYHDKSTIFTKTKYQILTIPYYLIPFELYQSENLDKGYTIYKLIINKINKTN